MPSPVHLTLHPFLSFSSNLHTFPMEAGLACTSPSSLSADFSRTFFLSYTLVPALYVFTRSPDRKEILTASLIAQQLTFGPSEAYERPPPLTLTPSSPLPVRSRRMSSSFSRISYGVHDDADPEEIKAALDKNGDGIVGVLFGKSVGEQIGSTWFWYVSSCIVAARRG